MPPKLRAPVKHAEALDVHRRREELRRRVEKQRAAREARLQNPRNVGPNVIRGLLSAKQRAQNAITRRDAVIRLHKNWGRGDYNVNRGRDTYIHGIPPAAKERLFESNKETAAVRALAKRIANDPRSAGRTFTGKIPVDPESKYVPSWSTRPDRRSTRWPVQHNVVDLADEVDTHTHHMNRDFNGERPRAIRRTLRNATGAPDDINAIIGAYAGNTAWNGGEDHEKAYYVKKREFKYRPRPDGSQ